MPTVTHRLGIGLAAAVSSKLNEQRNKILTALSDDSDFYDDESDTSEKRRFPDLIAKAREEDDFYLESSEEDEAEQLDQME